MSPEQIAARLSEAQRSVLKGWSDDEKADYRFRKWALLEKHSNVLTPLGQKVRQYVFAMETLHSQAGVLKALADHDKAPTHAE